MKKFYYLIVVSILIATFSLQKIFAQYECGTSVEENEALEHVLQINSCQPTSSDYMNYYRLQSFYIPDENTPVKVIPINFVVIQKSDPLDPGNFTINDTAFLKTFFTASNNTFINHASPSDPITGVCGSCHISDIKIRLELKGIYFVVDDVEWNNVRSNNGFNKHAVNPDFEFNVIFHGKKPNEGVSGIGVWPSYSDLTKRSFVRIHDLRQQYINGTWGLWKSLLAHEIGHCMELKHLYNHETCDLSSIDYLGDVFGPSGNQLCPHDGQEWNCNTLLHPRDKCTNNVMGNSIQGPYFSPLQLGRAHRAFALSSMRKYSNSYDPDLPFNITRDQTWDFDIKFFSRYCC